MAADFALKLNEWPATGSDNLQPLSTKVNKSAPKSHIFAFISAKRWPFSLSADRDNQSFAGPLCSIQQAAWR